MTIATFKTMEAAAKYAEQLAMIKYRDGNEGRKFTAARHPHDFSFVVECTNPDGKTGYALKANTHKLILSSNPVNAERLVDLFTQYVATLSDYYTSIGNANLKARVTEIASKALSQTLENGAAPQANLIRAALAINAGTPRKCATAKHLQLWVRGLV